MHPSKLLGLGLSIVVSGSAWAGTAIPLYTIAPDVAYPRQQLQVLFPPPDTAALPISSQRIIDAYEQIASTHGLPTHSIGGASFTSIITNNRGDFAGTITEMQPNGFSGFKSIFSYVFHYNTSYDSLALLTRLDYQAKHLQGSVDPSLGDIDSSGKLGVSWVNVQESRWYQGSIWNPTNNENLVLSNDLIEQTSWDQFIQYYSGFNIPSGVGPQIVGFSRFSDDGAMLVRINKQGFTPVYEFSAVLSPIDNTGPAQSIPTPGAAVAGLALMGGMVMRRRR